MGPYDQGDVKKKCLKQWKVRELVLLQKENCYDAKIFHSFETPWKIVLTKGTRATYCPSFTFEEVL